MVLSLLLAWEVGGWIAGENLQQVEYLFVAVAVAVVSVTILRNWRTGFYLFLVWVVFEDAVRKYLGNNMLIYFAKDFLVLLIYFSLYISVRDKKDRIFRPPFLVVLSLFFGGRLSRSSIQIRRAISMGSSVSKLISSTPL